MTEAAARPLRVLVSLPGRGANTNPYLLQLIDALEASGRVRISYFSWRRAVLGRYDVFHVHWPERLVRGSSAVRTLGRRLRFLLLLARLRATRVAVVRTVHNLAAHERGGRAERMLLRAFDRRTTLWIRLNPFTPVPAGRPSRTILHGHYRDWFPSAEAASPVPGRVLFFGLIRAYKGIEELLDAFRAVDDPAVSLRLVGSAQDPGLVAAIETAQQSDERITSRIAYVPDDDLAAEIGAAQLVVLPYRSVHNSGAAILALSLGRRVLMPRTDTTEWLQQEVGDEWLVTYPAALTPAVLAGAVRQPAAAPAPRLALRDWAPVADAHLAAFSAAVEAGRRGSGRGSRHRPAG